MLRDLADSSSRYQLGAISWQAPELLLHGRPKSLSGDIYSLGCVFHEVSSMQLELNDEYLNYPIDVRRTTSEGRVSSIQGCVGR